MVIPCLGIVKSKERRNNMIIDNEIAYPYKHNKNYYVTRSGKIYSIYIVGGQGNIDIKNPHLLKYGEDKDGYYRVVLSLNGKRKYKKVHAVIVEQFIGEIPNEMVVNHIDGNIHNNDVTNLEIVTPKENTIHAHVNGLTSSEIKVNVTYKNKEHTFASLSECMKFFPEISRHYLEQLRKGIVQFSNVYFEKTSDERIGNINCFYNGMLYKVFKSMKDSDEFFGKSKGSTYSAMKFNRYRKRSINISSHSPMYRLSKTRNTPEVSRVHDW